MQGGCALGVVQGGVEDAHCGIMPLYEHPAPGAQDEQAACASLLCLYVYHH